MNALFLYTCALYVLKTIQSHVFTSIVYNTVKQYEHGIFHDSQFQHSIEFDNEC